MKPRLLVLSVILTTAILLSGCETTASENITPNVNDTAKSAVALPTSTFIPSPTATLQIPVSQGTPVPLVNEIITSENADQIVELARWGEEARWRKGTLTGGKLSVYSPDGKQIAIGADGGIHIFDSETLAELMYLSIGASIKEIGYSPDGKLIAVTSGNGIIILNVADLSIAHSFEGNCFAFSPNSEFLATCGKELMIWNLSNEELINTFTGHSLDVGGAIFAPDGNSIFSFSNINLSQNQISDGELLQSFSVKPGGWSIDSISISPDGTTLSISNILNEWAIYLYDVTKKAQIARLENEVFGPGVVFSPDNNFLATTTGFGSVGIWKASDGEKVLKIGAEELDRTFENAKPGQLISVIPGGSVDYSPDGKTLLQAEDDGIRLWNVADGSLINENIVLSTPKFDLALSPEGDVLASITEGGTIELMQYPSGTVINNQLVSNARNLEFLGDGRMIVLTEGKVSLISLDNIDEPKILTENQRSPRIAVSSDSSLIAFKSRSQDNTLGVSVINIVDGKESLFINTAGFGEISSIEFSPDGQYIAVSFPGLGLFGQPMGGLTKLYFGSNGEFIRFNKPDVTSAVEGTKLAFSPDGKILATVTDERVYLWDIKERKLAFSFDKPPFVSSITFSPDGALLVVGDKGGKITLLSATDGASVAVLDGHSSTINEVLFTNDGVNLISSSVDGTIRIWGLKP